LHPESIDTAPPLLCARAFWFQALRHKQTAAAMAAGGEKNMKDNLYAIGDVMEELASLVTEVPRVLHVDGDADAALVLATLLVPETEVVHVATLAEALRKVEQASYALVVLDPDLPDGDGTVLLEQLRHRQERMPVLLYSARHPGLRLQAHAFLPKPWTSPRQLWRTVSHLLGIEPVILQEETT
jgi:CheY-like chemotaxis protein